MPVVRILGSSSIADLAAESARKLPKGLLQGTIFADNSKATKLSQAGEVKPVTAPLTDQSSYPSSTTSDCTRQSILGKNSSDMFDSIGDTDSPPLGDECSMPRSEKGLYSPDSTSKVEDIE
jgi:hypothetical protein